MESDECKATGEAEFMHFDQVLNVFPRPQRRGRAVSGPFTVGAAIGDMAISGGLTDIRNARR